MTDADLMVKITASESAPGSWTPLNINKYSSNSNDDYDDDNDDTNHKDQKQQQQQQQQQQKKQQKDSKTFRKKKKENDKRKKKTKQDVNAAADGGRGLKSSSIFYRARKSGSSAASATRTTENTTMTMTTPPRKEKRKNKQQQQQQQQQHRYSNGGGASNSPLHNDNVGEHNNSTNHNGYEDHYPPVPSSPEIRKEFGLHSPAPVKRRPPPLAAATSTGAAAAAAGANTNGGAAMARRTTSARPFPVPGAASPANKVDKFGFLLDPVDEYDEDGLGNEPLPPNPFQERLIKSRERKWMAMMGPQRKEIHKLKKRSRKGIPDSIRGKAWVNLGNVPKYRKEHPHLYGELVAKAFRDIQEHDEAGMPIKEHVVRETIDRDIHRTYPKHFLFCEPEDEEEELPNNHGDCGILTSLDSVFPHDSAMTRNNNRDIPSILRDDDDEESLSTNKVPISSWDFSNDRASKILDAMQCNDTRSLAEEPAEVPSPSYSAPPLSPADNASTLTPTTPTSPDVPPPTTTTTTPKSPTTVSSALSANTPTTKPDHSRATGGQASLRRVLRAYSLYDSDVGYCQGMNFIAAMFITLMKEEEAFWLLVGIMKDKPCRMRGLFGEGMSEAHQVLHVADRLIVQFLPKLAKHLEQENVHITMFATQWLLTIYTSSFPFDMVVRVWDCFLEEGWKIVYRVMLALLTLSQPELVHLSFEDILATFRDIPQNVNTKLVMDTALKIPLKRRHIDKYEVEYQETLSPR